MKREEHGEREERGESRAWRREEDEGLEQRGEKRREEEQAEEEQAGSGKSDQRKDRQKRTRGGEVRRWRWGRRWR